MSLQIKKRMSSEDIYDLLNKKPKTRTEYIEKFEASYNFGPQDFPPQVFIELTSVCNLNCSFCGYSSMEREKSREWCLVSYISILWRATNCAKLFCKND